MISLIACRGKGLVSCAIKFQTRSQYSHVGLLFSDGIFYEATWPQVRKCGKVPESYDYDVYSVPSTSEQEALVRAFCEKQLGKPYDLTMVIRFVTRGQESRKSKGAWFCSEYAFAALRVGGIHLLKNIEPWAVSPELVTLSPLLERQTGKFTEIVGVTK